MVAKREELIQVKILPSDYNSPESFFEAVQTALKDKSLKPGKPAILVFDEMLFSKPIPRKESKEIIGKLSSILERHGETYAFLTVGETIGRNRYSNTAHIVRPSKDEKGRRWLAYPKRALTKIDKDTIAALAKKQRLGTRKKARKRLEAHYKQRGKKGIQDYEFETPTVKIAGRTVAIAACADVAHSRTLAKSDLVIIPSRGIALRMIDIYLLKEAKMKKGSRLVFTDALTHKKVVQELNFRYTHPKIAREEIGGKAKYDFSGPLLIRNPEGKIGPIRRLKKGRIHRL